MGSESIIDHVAMWWTHAVCRYANAATAAAKLHTRAAPEGPAAEVRRLVAEARHGGDVPPAALEQALGVVGRGDLW